MLDAAPSRSGRPIERAAPEPARPAAPAGPPPGADELLSRLAAEPLTPPSLTADDQAAAAWLAGQGQIVRASRELAFTAEGFEQARAAAVELAGASGSVTLAQLRDRLGVSRKFAQALLEAMDAQGVTRRVGDERVLRRRGRQPST